MDITPRSSMDGPDTSQDKPKKPDQSAVPPEPTQQSKASQPDATASPSSPPAGPKPFSMDSPPEQTQEPIASSATSSVPSMPQQQPVTSAQASGSTNFNVEEAMKAEPAPSAVPQAAPSTSTDAVDQITSTPTENTPPTGNTTDKLASTDGPQNADKNSSQPSPSPAASTQASESGAASAGKSGGKKRLSLPWIIAIVTAIIVLAGAFVFGYYLPSQPESVYRTGLERSGDVIHDLIIEATEADQLEALRRMQMTGSMTFSTDDIEFVGSLTSLLDEQNSDSSFDIALASGGQDDIGISGDVRTVLVANERFPDIYFQLTGMASLGLNAYLPGIESYDGQWISINSELLESLLGEYYDEAADTQVVPELDEYRSLIRDISATTNEYVFSADEETAVIQMEEFLGQEDLGDISANRYSASINQDNAVAYCQELVTVFYRSDLNRTLTGDDEEATESKITTQKEQCQDLPEEAVTVDETFDVWIDRSTKLIHKVRVSDAENSQNYTEVGQRYSGGDELELFIYTQEDERSATVTFKTNLESNVSSINANLAQEGEGAYVFNADIRVEPHAEEINAEMPTGAVSIEQVMEELFGGALSESLPQSVQSENFQGEVEFQQPQQLSEDLLLQTLTNLL
jgi:hypothetical protein